jgi:hypothetical protein
VRRGLPLLAIAAAAGLAAATQPGSAQTVCSVFDKRPCTPTVCSVFDHHPCVPDLPYPFGDGLRLTVKTQGRPSTAPAKPLNTIRDLFDALGACWEPPPLDQSSPGTEITIRFSLNRAGAVIGEPRFTYSTRSLSQEVKSAYRRAVTAALERCTPLPLSAGLGGAIAGRPISTRFIDNREHRTENRT